MIALTLSSSSPANFEFTGLIGVVSASTGSGLIAEFDLAGSAALLRLGNDELLEEMGREI